MTPEPGWLYRVIEHTKKQRKLYDELYNNLAILDRAYKKETK